MVGVISWNRSFIYNRPTVYKAVKYIDQMEKSYWRIFGLYAWLISQFKIRNLTWHHKEYCYIVVYHQRKTHTPIISIGLIAVQLKIYNAKIKTKIHIWCIELIKINMVTANFPCKSSSSPPHPKKRFENPFRCLKVSFRTVVIPPAFSTRLK